MIRRQKDGSEDIAAEISRSVHLKAIAGGLGKEERSILRAVAYLSALDALEHTGYAQYSPGATYREGRRRYGDDDALRDAFQAGARWNGEHF